MTDHNREECIQSCQQCFEACERCANECLHERELELTRCIEVSLVCADTCAFTRHDLARGSNWAEKIALLCAEICDVCREECDKHDQEACLVCARACEECAEKCRQFVGLAEAHLAV